MKTRSANHRSGPQAKKRKSEASLSIDVNDEEKVHVIRKDVKKRTKGKLGKLAGLLDLPLDILFEVFGNLKPHDLLKVARTTKEFRHLLMSRSSVSVWRAALSSIPDLPPCPPDMCEPAWVNLVFDPHCHFCQKPNVRIVEWLLRTRICNTCAKSQLFDMRVPLETPTKDSPSFPIQTLLLSRPSKKPAFLLRTFILDQLAEMKDKYAAFQDAEARTEFICERRKYIAEVAEHAVQCAEWAQAQTDDRSIELDRLRLDRLVAISDRLKELGYAEDIAGMRFPHSLADHELVKKPQKLTERIWMNIRGPIIAFMDKMHALRLQREHKEKTLLRKPTAVAVYREYMATRYPQDDILPSGLDFCAFAPVKTILEQPVEVTVDETSFADAIERIPEFIASWRQSVDHRLVKVLNRQLFLEPSNGWNEFGEFCDDDEEERLSDSADDHPLSSEQLGSSSNVSVTDDSILSEGLKLATTIFQCTKCASRSYIDGGLSEDDYALDDSNSTGTSSFFFYPKVKGHLCLVRKLMSEDVFSDDDEEDVDPYFITRPNDPARKLENTRELRRMWSTSPLRVNRRLGRVARVLVEVAGLNPDKATADEMDATGLWFACVQCAYNCDGFDSKQDNSSCCYEMPAYTWRLALEHLWSEHHHVEPLLKHWITVTSDDMNDAVEAWKDHPRSSHQDTRLAGVIFPSPSPPPAETTWCCVYCKDTPAEVSPTSMQAIIAHLEEKHHIHECEENRDYYKDFAAVPPSLPQRNVVIPVSNKLVEEALKEGAISSRISALGNILSLFAASGMPLLPGLFGDLDSEDDWY